MKDPIKLALVDLQDLAKAFHQPSEELYRKIHRPEREIAELREALYLAQDAIANALKRPPE